jgi:hypothetical protein
MRTESLLDQSRVFVVFGPDEKIWVFKYESQAKTTGMVGTYDWQAYSRKPGYDVFLPSGAWPEDSVHRFLTKHSRKLTDSERIDLWLYLHKGGIEAFLKKNRIAVKGER